MGVCFYCDEDRFEPRFAPSRARFLHPTLFFDKNSKTLILGSFPSIESRKVGMYFANKTNRFWYIISSVYKEKITEERYEIETYMTDYCSSYVPSFLVPESNDPNISPKIYRWDSSLKK